MWTTSRDKRRPTPNSKGQEVAWGRLKSHRICVALPDHSRDMSDKRSSRASSSTGSSSSFSPTISGFYGADAETAKDVVMLVNDVRQVGGESVYRPFIRLLKDCAARRYGSPVNITGLSFGCLTP